MRDLGKLKKQLKSKKAEIISLAVERGKLSDRQQVIARANGQIPLRSMSRRALDMSLYATVMSLPISEQGLKEAEEFADSDGKKEFYHWLEQEITRQEKLNES